MFRRTLALLTLITFSNACISQTPFGDLKVFKARFDPVNKASIIPDSIFSMRIDLLHLAFPVDTSVSNEKYGYEIRWPSLYVDGSLILTITKRQIYLRSGHNNPNPNYLYWFVNISEEQYRIIESKINADKNLFEQNPSEYTLYKQLYYRKFKPEKGIPKKWTTKSEERSYKDWLDKKYANTDELISFFDDGLTVDNIIPFVSKENFEKNEPVRIVFSEEDYEGQIKLIRVKD